MISLIDLNDLALWKGSFIISIHIYLFVTKYYNGNEVSVGFEFSLLFYLWCHTCFMKMRKKVWCIKRILSNGCVYRPSIHASFRITLLGDFYIWFLQMCHLEKRSI